MFRSLSTAPWTLSYSQRSQIIQYISDFTSYVLLVNNIHFNSKLIFFYNSIEKDIFTSKNIETAFVSNGFQYIFLKFRYIHYKYIYRFGVKTENYVLLHNSILFRE